MYFVTFSFLEVYLNNFLSIERLVVNQDSNSFGYITENAGKRNIRKSTGFSLVSLSIERLDSRFNG